MADIKKKLKMINRAQQKKRCLLYLDILGYKNYLNNNDNQQKTLGIIKTVYEIMVKETLGYEFEKIKINKEIEFYSDNIVITSDLYDDKDDAFRIFDMLYRCASIQYDTIFVNKMLLRGAITVGDCYVGEFAFGDAFIRAYHLESKKADWARVIVSKEIVDKMADFDDRGYLYMKKDGEIHFLDFMKMSDPMSEYAGVFTEKDRLDKFYQVFKQVYYSSVTGYIGRILEFKESLDVAKIISKNNQLLNYINEYYKSKGYENLIPLEYVEEDLYIKLKKYQSDFDNMNVDNIGRLKKSFEELILAYCDYHTKATLRIQ